MKVKFFNVPMDVNQSKYESEINEFLQGVEVLKVLQTSTTYEHTGEKGSKYPVRIIHLTIFFTENSKKPEP